MAVSPFIPRSAPFTFERFDQGEDFRTTPGGEIIAPWAGRVSLAPSDPGGFGTHYGLYTPTQGPYKNRTFYIGHAFARVGRAIAGSIIATVGKGTESWMGNAKGIPGHVEIGFWPPGSMSSGRNVKRAVESGAAVSGVSAPERFIATAYGPPWGGIQGGGTTATGIDLSRAPHRYLVAVDPSVIPMHTKLRIWPNPFSNKPIIFAAEDTGGAIKGHRIDFYDWRGRKTQNIWGSRPVNVEIVDSAATFNGPRVRPGDPNAGGPDALDAAFSLDFADAPGGIGAATPDVANTGDTNMLDVGIFGLPSVAPLPKGTPGAGTEIPVVPDAMSIYRATKDAINSTTDFLKWIAWIFHPHNILRAIETIFGFNIMLVGLYLAIQSHTKSGGGQHSSGKAKRTVSRVVQASPAGRTVRAARGARAGRQAVRHERRREEFNTARKQGAAKERQKGSASRRRARRQENRKFNKRFGDDPPF